MTSSRRDYIYNSSFDVWVFVSNIFNVDRVTLPWSLCMCARMRALKVEIRTDF